MRKGNQREGDLEGVKTRKDKDLNLNSKHSSSIVWVTDQVRQKGTLNPQEIAKIVDNLRDSCLHFNLHHVYLCLTPQGPGFTY